MRQNKTYTSNNRKYRRVIDISMSMIMLLVMYINIIGQQLHEYLGMLLGVLFLIHLYLNRRWAVNLTKGRYSSKRVLQTILNIALLLVMFIQMFSGIMIARYLPFHGPAGAMQLMTWIHTNAGYIGFILMSQHAAMHIHPIRKNKRIKSAAKVVFMFLITIAALMLVYIWKKNNGLRKEAEYVVSEETTEYVQLVTGETDARSDQATPDFVSAEEESAVADEPVPKETDELSGFQIVFDFNRASTPASNQITIWVEDESGNLVRTVMVTSFTGSRRGYEWRPMSLNHWIEKAKPQNISDTELDSISGATPATGTHMVTWDLLDNSGNKVTEGNYVIKVEGTLYWESNILYQAVVDTGNADTISEVTVQRSNPENSKNEDMLTSVSIFPISSE